MALVATIPIPCKRFGGLLLPIETED